MQVWDAVKVKEGVKNHAGEAGVIQALDKDNATVKLDLYAKPIVIAIADLSRL